MMSKLNPAQKKWLFDLGILVGGAASGHAPSPAAKAQGHAAGTLAQATVTGAKSPEAEAQSPKAEASAVAPATTQAVEVLEDRRREFKRARAQWVAVKTRAEEDLEKVKAGARRTYMADASQFPKVMAGCKAIDNILDNIDDELRDTLDRYASTPVRAQAKLAALAATAISVLERYQQYVGANAMMRAIDEKEFADVAVHAPVVKALRDLRKSLA